MMTEKSLIARRKRTFQLLIELGQPMREVLEVVAEEFDTTEAIVEADIVRMGYWVDDLPPRVDASGKFRLQELRHMRLRLYKMVSEVREQGDIEVERRIMATISQSILTDLRLSHSLDLAFRESGMIDPPEEITPEDPLFELINYDPAVDQESR